MVVSEPSGNMVWMDIHSPLITIDRLNFLKEQEEDAKRNIHKLFLGFKLT
jgi:hypothetical protein